MSTSTSTYQDYLDNLWTQKGISKQEIDRYLQPYILFTQLNFPATAVPYVLDLHSQKYLHMGQDVHLLFGFEDVDFANKGTSILQDLLVKEDFETLSSVLFPKMNKVVSQFSPSDQKRCVFELHYKIKTPNGTEKSIIEHASYVKFNEDNLPALSAGVCFEVNHSVVYEGVRGMIKFKEEKVQKVLFDEFVSTTKTNLTKREKEIILSIAEGLSSNQISEKLHISPHTVTTHRKNILKKLNFNSSPELVNFAIQHLGFSK